MAKPFQESAESWKAKNHLGKVKTPVLVGISALLLVALYLILQNVWTGLTSDSFELVKQGDAAAPEETVANGTDEKGFEDKKPIVVHVAGAVVGPGVFELEEGDRLSAAIEAAGGLREDAAPEGINLARELVDGEQVIVPTQEEYTALPSAPEGEAPVSQKININTATEAELTDLPGIGEVTAEKIVADREKSGPFPSIEDIKRVSGIGEKKFEQIADSICV